jgi:hypothetical protein
MDHKPFVGMRSFSNSYRQYAIVVRNLDTSELIGRQFKGVGDYVSVARKQRTVWVLTQKPKKPYARAC